MSEEENLKIRRNLAGISSIAVAVRDGRGIPWNMKRILLKVAYDGEGYAGFARQPGQETIEGVLDRTISELTGVTVRVIGASRTDAGVHALCNIAVFDTESRIPPEKFAYALNRRLPPRIRIQDSFEVAPDFHPRHCSTVKTYEYHIYNAEFEDPLHRRYSFHTWYPLDVKAMDEAGQYLVGEHDFRSFCSIYTQAETTVRTILAVSVTEAPAMTAELYAQQAQGHLEYPRDITIRVQGTGFLYNMVRIIAGTLIEVGRGARRPEDMKMVLEARDRRAAGPTAPAPGLLLRNFEFLVDPHYHGNDGQPDSREESRQGCSSGLS